MKRWLTLFLFTTLLVACSTPAAVTDTPLPPTVTLQPTETLTPTPEAMATATETPTPEVKQFPICQIENFRDCLITVDDLFNGNYLRWLNTLSKPFDQSKIKQVPMEVVFGNIITYNTKTAQLTSNLLGSMMFARGNHG